MSSSRSHSTDDLPPNPRAPICDSTVDANSSGAMAHCFTSLACHREIPYEPSIGSFPRQYCMRTAITSVDPVLPPGMAEFGAPFETKQESITALLSSVNDGDRNAFDRLMPLVYRELHRIAEGYLRRENQNHTLQPTALIHEAYLRL